MVSLLTNGNALTALRQLRSVQDVASVIRSQLSTGLKVQSAKDNAAFFLVSSTTNGDLAIINGLRENLVLDEGAFKAAEAGLRELNDLVLQMVDMIPVAQNGVGIEQLEIAYDELVDQMVQTIEASGFQDTNLLVQEDTTTSVIGLDRDGSSFGFQTLSVDGADYLRRTFGGLTETNNQFVIDPASSAYAFTEREGEDFASHTDPADGINAWEIIDDPTDPNFGMVHWAQDPIGQDGYGDVTRMDLYSPRMDVAVEVQNPGTYYINVRGFGTSGSSDSIHVGIDGTRITDNGGVNLPGGGSPGWGSRSTSGADVSVNITTPGIYTINIWGREDGVYIDRVEFTVDPVDPPNTYDPPVTQLGGSDLPYYTNVIDGEARREAAGLIELVQAVTPDAMRLNPDQAMLVLDSARSKIARYQSQVGAYEKTVDRQRNYLADLEDGLTGSVAALVEADLEEASSRLAAIQVQEQLAIQSLSIANNRTSSLLSLFN